MLLVAASLVLHASGTYAYAPDLYMHGMWSRWTRAPLVLAPLLLGTREGVALATLFVIHLFYAEAQSRQLNAEFWHRVIATESLAAAHVELRRETEIRQRAEIELRLAQKLESVGRLATGIAHEINTPLQAMLGSLDFIGEGVRDLIDITRAYEAALPATIRATLAPDIARELAYLVENLPESLALANDCLDRTATIVRSVKTFAHPSATAKAQVDLNHALVTTLAVARHACDGVADIVTELDDLPLVDGYAGELNQVFLNLIVNAVDAMAPLAEATGRRGTLTLTTRREGDHVCIAFADTGVGIPDRIKDSIFDPFFTTKAPGKGTGQGLMIAHTVVHQRHGGELTFASTVGRGTTFTVRLPVARPASPRAASCTTTAG
jgi:signal transduction histidine kinase